MSEFEEFLRKNGASVNKNTEDDEFLAANEDLNYQENGGYPDDGYAHYWCRRSRFEWE